MTANQLCGLRRVVTGVDADGRSKVISDAPPPHIRGRVAVLWGTDAQTRLPMAYDPANFLTDLIGETASTRLMATLVLPDEQRDAQRNVSADSPGVTLNARSESGGRHTTDSVDYIIIAAGEVWCVLDNETVHLRAGDILVQTGTRHAWSNRTTTPCLLYCITVGVTRDATPTETTKKRIE